MPSLERVEIRFVERGFIAKVQVRGQELRERVFEQADTLLEWLTDLMLDRESPRAAGPEYCTCDRCSGLGVVYSEAGPDGDHRRVSCERCRGTGILETQSVEEP
jgi:hypothetical protein